MATLADDLEKLVGKKQKATEAKKKWQKLKDDADQWEFHCYERMEAERTDSQKVAGVNFVKYDQEFGQVQDRSKFVEWALENDPELVESKERQELINTLARRLLADGAEFPPGLGFRINNKVGVRGAGKAEE